MLKITTKVTRRGGRFIDNIRYPIACPKCGQKSQQSLTRLQDDPVLTCDACSHQFKVDSGGTARQAANQVKELDRQIERLFK